jgi:hypothetical protein
MVGASKYGGLRFFFSSERNWRREKRLQSSTFGLILHLFLYSPTRQTDYVLESATFVSRMDTNTID